MYIVKVIICVFFLVTGFSCGKAPSDLPAIRMALLKGPSAIAFSNLLDSVYCIQGKQFETVLYDNPMKVQALMIQKKIDVAVLPLSSAVNLYNKNTGYSLLACPVWGNLFWISSGNKADRPPFPVFLFGQGTTSDVLLKYLQSVSALQDVYPDYTYSTPQDLFRALISRQISDAILPEPFVSLALQKDSSLFVRCDLAKEFSPNGFAQTAVVVSSEIKQDIHLLNSVDSLLSLSVRKSTPENPETESRLIHYKILPGKIDLATVYDRCRIEYRSRSSVRNPVDTLLQVIFKYYPKSIGGKFPDDRFYISDNSI